MDAKNNITFVCDLCGDTITYERPKKNAPIRHTCAVCRVVKNPSMKSNPTVRRRIFEEVHTPREQQSFVLTTYAKVLIERTDSRKREREDDQRRRQREFLMKIYDRNVTRTVTVSGRKIIETRGRVASGFSKAINTSFTN